MADIDFGLYFILLLQSSTERPFSETGRGGRPKNRSLLSDSFLCKVYFILYCFFLHFFLFFTLKVVRDKSIKGESPGLVVMFERSWVRIPEPYTGWSFFHISI